MVFYLDFAVGKIVDKLKAKGVWNRTLWVCQSDNGGPSFTGDNHTASEYRVDAPSCPVSYLISHVTLIATN
eukprot:COSAG01_NODE_5236_length_4393_cov_2.037727_2_plen_71_part_00